MYERELNIQFSPEVNVQVLEEDFKTLYFVLPACPEIDELSEEHLEAIAGGKAGPYDTSGRENRRRVAKKIYKVVKDRIFDRNK